MGITLHQITLALAKLGASDARVVCAIVELRTALAELDEIEVKGRENVDTLLGCMMAIEAIIGKGEEHG